MPKINKIKIILIFLLKALICQSALQNVQKISSSSLSSQLQPQSQKHNHTIYHFIPSYSEYQKKFQQKAGVNNTIQMTQYGTGIQLCANRQVCRFFVYKYQPQNVSNIQKTIFITSGMHGNQLIGPTSLLYLYQLLKPDRTRIIYFPICNPSGYELKTRITYPNAIDLNRDFPIDNNAKCYYGSSTRIIDKIYRIYEIDLTINLHNGGDQIGWNWGTQYDKNNPYTHDENIYNDIGKMLNYYGGYNKKLGIKPFDVGTMNQVIYPARGTLDDWAYAGSWHKSTLPKCVNYQYEPYPKNMHKGLVYLFQLGKHNATENMLGTSQGLNQPATAQKLSNGYVTRAIRMLRALVKVVNPTFSAEIRLDMGKENEKLQGTVFVKIQGCNTVDSLFLNIEIQAHDDKNNSQIYSRQKISNLELTTIQNSFTHIGNFKFSSNKQLTQPKFLPFQYKIAYSYKCDKKWQSKGSSFLANSQQRSFSGLMVISLFGPAISKAMRINQTNNWRQFIKVNGQYIYKQIGLTTILGSVIVSAVVIGLLYLLLMRKIKQNRKNKQQSPNNKFETITKKYIKKLQETQLTENEQNSFEQKIDQSIESIQQNKQHNSSRETNQNFTEIQLKNKS